MKTELIPPTVTPEGLARRVVSDGGYFLVGEYRGSKVTLTEYLDKESGKKESYVKVVHSIEAGTDGSMETVHLHEYIDRLIKAPDQYHTWLRRGMKILVLPRSMTAERGIKTFVCGSGDMLLMADGTTTAQNEKP